MFNKHNWIDGQRELLLDSAQNGATHDELQDQLMSDIDSECIYYADCFDIIKTLGFTDWSEAQFEVNNVTQAAYCALYELANEEIDIYAILKEAGNAGETNE
jgi:hypothetical protein